jgi:glycosyltransferase involved in cell wall biosynthesis
LKVTIVTVVYNNEKYIKDALESVISQNYSSIEYIVIDGGSTDRTLEIIEEYRDNISIFLSEPDEGIYDALNKGIHLSSGDVIAILQLDDMFSDKYVVSDMVNKMSETQTEFCFSDLVIIDNNSGKILRYYMANYYKRWMFRMGWLPPHPTCFIKKTLFDEFGKYSLKYKMAGDFDFLVRIFYGRDIKWSYLNRIIVIMRSGGFSNSGHKSKVLAAKEIARSLDNNNVWSLPFFQIGRYVIRLMEMIVKPKNSCSLK